MALEQHEVVGLLRRMRSDADQLQEAYDAGTLVAHTQYPVCDIKMRLSELIGLQPKEAGA